MKGVNGKPRLTGIFVGMTTLLFVCGYAHGEVYQNLPMEGGPVLGVRITGFSNIKHTGSMNLIAGVFPLEDSQPAMLNMPEDWRYSGEGCNRLHVTYSPPSPAVSSGTLTVGIEHGDSCDDLTGSHIHQVEYPNIPSVLTTEWQRAAFESGLNLAYLKIANYGPGTNIELKNLDWETIENFGSFSSDGEHDYTYHLIRGSNGTSSFIGPASSFSFVADLVLSGESSTDGVFFTANSLVELQFGKYVPPNLPPNCDNVVPTVTTIWPPSGNIWVVGLNVGDPDEADGDYAQVQVTEIQQDEPVCDSAVPCEPDGDFEGGTAKIRAERNGMGNGRIYTIYFTATDTRGGTCTGHVLVGVPKNLGKNAVPVKDELCYNSRSKATCP